MVTQTLTNFNLEERHYYLFSVSINTCDGSCNTAEDPFDRIFIPNEIKDKNLKAFNIIKGINKSKALAKHISCECRCETKIKQ